MVLNKAVVVVAISRANKRREQRKAAGVGEAARNGSRQSGEFRFQRFRLSVRGRCIGAHLRFPLPYSKAPVPSKWRRRRRKELQRGRWRWLGRNRHPITFPLPFSHSGKITIASCRHGEKVLAKIRKTAIWHRCTS